MRSLIALGVLAALAVILWFFYSSQAHPAGTLGYDYLNDFSGFLATLVVVAALVVLRMVLGTRKRN
jgi:hypothetical protein